LCKAGGTILSAPHSNEVFMLDVIMIGRIETIDSHTIKKNSNRETKEIIAPNDAMVFHGVIVSG